jgi:tetratricopeptide (TPR) repeat protein
VEAAREQVRRDGNDAGARVALAELYVRTAKPQEAVVELTTAARIAPKDPEPLRRLAAIYRSAEYLDREAEALEQATRLDPGDWKSALRLADIYMDMGWFDLAQKAINRAVGVAPGQKEVVVGQATLLFLRNEYVAMESVVQAALRKWPGDVGLNVMMAEVSRVQGRHLETERYLLQAIRLSDDPTTQARDHTALAHLYLDKVWGQPRYADAEQAARAALEKNPEEMDAHYWLGRALDLQGKNAEAAEHYAIAAKRDIRFESVAFHLGRIYQRSPDATKREEAKRLLSIYATLEANGRTLSKAYEDLRRNDRDPRAHLNLGSWYLKARKYPQAIMEMQRALKLRPGDKAARRLLAAALNSSGRVTEAKAYQN